MERGIAEEGRLIGDSGSPSSTQSLEMFQIIKFVKEGVFLIYVTSPKRGKDYKFDVCNDVHCPEKRFADSHLGTASKLSLRAQRKELKVTLSMVEPRVGRSSKFSHF